MQHRCSKFTKRLQKATQKTLQKENKRGSWKSMQHLNVMRFHTQENISKNWITSFFQVGYNLILHFGISLVISTFSVIVKLHSCFESQSYEKQWTISEFLPNLDVYIFRWETIEKSLESSWKQRRKNIEFSKSTKFW